MKKKKKMLQKYIFPPETQQITNIFSEANFLFCG